ncbi:MAG: hypothetical protein ACYTCN_02400 [Planctomycetota bacterium]|jgi:hypothetical protein
MSDITKFDALIPSLALIAALVLGAALMASGLERKLQPKECVEAAAQQ